MCLVSVGLLSYLSRILAEGKSCFWANFNRSIFNVCTTHRKEQPEDPLPPQEAFSRVPGAAAQHLEVAASITGTRYRGRQPHVYVNVHVLVN